MTGPARPPASPAAAPPAPSGGGLKGFQNAIGGKKGLAIGGAVIVGGLALYERHKSKTSASSSAAQASANPDAGATTDMNSLPDWNWSSYYEQQTQGTNPIQPPTATGTPPPTAPIPTAPTPVVHGGSPPRGTTPPVKAIQPQLNQNYTVKRGDTLWAIAKKYLGNGEDYPEIYQANKSVIGPDPNKIYPGEHLKV